MASRESLRIKQKERPNPGGAMPNIQQQMPPQYEPYPYGTRGSHGAHIGSSAMGGLTMAFEPQQVMQKPGVPMGVPQA